MMDNAALLSPSPSQHTEKRRVSVLGATGSIGQQTLTLLRQHRANYDIVALTAQNNVEALIEEALEFQPKLAVIGNPEHYNSIKDALSHTSTEVAAGEDAIIDAAQREADWVMAAIVGAAGLRATYAAIQQGTHVALANKESLVCAGSAVMQACDDYNTMLLPVDSEHNAIFQVLNATTPEEIATLTLTASGGPFRTTPLNEMAHITPQQAVAHPNWSMGAKISVDSATMMNKGLEMIEAYHLFPVESQQIEILIHPESVIHSMVSYCDGSVLAQMGSPDMTIPIAHTLAWPERMKTTAQKLDLAAIGSLHFEAVDHDRFPAVALCREALQTSQEACCILNAANEIAVAAFLENGLPYNQIVPVVAQMLDRITPSSISSIDDAIALDAETRTKTTALITERD